MSSCVTGRTSRRRRKQVISESSEEESDVEEAPCRSPPEDQAGPGETSRTDTSPCSSRRLTMQVKPRLAEFSHSPLRPSQTIAAHAGSGRNHLAAVPPHHCSVGGACEGAYVLAPGLLRPQRLYCKLHSDPSLAVPTVPRPCSPTATPGDAVPTCRYGCLTPDMM